MHNPTSVSQEPSAVLDLGSQIGRFTIDSSFINLGSDACSSALSNFLYFNGARGGKRSVSLSLKVRGGLRFRSFLHEFNRAVRFHCERIPIGTKLQVNEFMVQVFVTDLWSDHTPWPFNQLPRSYSFLVKHGPLWKMTYYGTAPRLVHQSNFAATSTFIAREVAKGLMKYQPDIIISVHPLMQHVPLRILRAKGLLKKIVFTTVVTDLSTCHPTWFHKLVTRCYCPTTDVAKRALKAGLQQSQIKIYGLPVRPSFVKPVRSKVELRRELGMDEDLPAVLLMGGGEGMGPIEATARALGDSLNDENLGAPMGQILVICGRNKKLANKLNSINWKIPVQVKGFVTKMEECMGACDCIITKAGPGTIAEAMIRGLPIILNDYIAGQEAGNVPYVVENGCGKFSKSPKEIAKIVAEWFGPKAYELQIMSQNALRLARSDAVFKIVHDLHELVRQRSFLPEYSCTA
ncbi:Glycosyl transferase, family 28, C-terminal [Sesbania bispinosa]|nr:Glycosyl transferase, family 28, C-terminal [Sesbania bispinosa]